MGNGSWGLVKEALWTAPPDGKPIKVAAKLILKKSVRGQESVVYDEIEVLQGLDHPNVGECEGAKRLDAAEYRPLLQSQVACGAVLPDYIMQTDVFVIA